MERKPEETSEEKSLVFIGSVGLGFLVFWFLVLLFFGGISDFLKGYILSFVLIYLSKILGRGVKKELYT